MTAVGGGILVFDDEQWSGRITATEVAGIAAASDSITIGVRPDGASVAATSGGILTVTPPNGQLQIVQPPAPAAGAQVWRVAGLLGEYAVLVWAVAEHPELPCTVTTLSVESGQAVGSGSATSDLVEGSEFVRCGRGGAFAGLLVAPDGVLRPVPDGVVVAGSAGDVLEGARGSDKVHVDPSTGAATAAPADGLWHLTGSMTSWVKSKSTVWFVDRKKEKS